MSLTACRLKVYFTATIVMLQLEISAPAELWSYDLAGFQPSGQIFGFANFRLFTAPFRQVFEAAPDDLAIFDMGCSWAGVQEIVKVQSRL